VQCDGGGAERASAVRSARPGSCGPVQWGLRPGLLVSDFWVVQFLCS